MTQPRSKSRQKLIWWSAAALFVLHHDFWWWNDSTLVLGFLPIGLAYHIGFSVAASVLWFAAVKFAWPTHIEEFAEGGNPPKQSNPPKP